MHDIPKRKRLVASLVLLFILGPLEVLFAENEEAAGWAHQLV